MAFVYSPSVVFTSLSFYSVSHGNIGAVSSIDTYASEPQVSIILAIFFLFTFVFFSRETEFDHSRQSSRNILLQIFTHHPIVTVVYLELLEIQTGFKEESYGMGSLHTTDHSNW
jgi:hypothetical protein